MGKQKWLFFTFISNKRIILFKKFMRIITTKFIVFSLLYLLMSFNTKAQEGLNLVSDFYPGTESSQPIQFVKVNNHLLFSVLDSDTLAAYYSINSDKSITKLFNYLPPNGHGTGISVLI